MSYESNYYPGQGRAYGPHLPAERARGKVPAGAVALVVGILAHVLLIVGVSMGDQGAIFAAAAVVLAIIGAPMAIVGLVRRVRAKQSYGIPVAAVTVNVAFVALVALALTAATRF